MIKFRCLVITFSVLISGGLRSQSASSSAEILHQLQKLRNTTRVLYLAAHPDDENTAMISWLENHRHMRTAYLSLTRGDGGQNLIGTELGAKLGVLRTQELMQARAIDGGEQFFTRAVDFGYSKTADETFRQWNKDEVLADVVWTIRRFQPDIIITRFPPDERAGHGHHTVSAMLAEEAFELAADPKAYTQQLQYLDPWQVKRQFWNHSTWWRQNLDSIAAADDRYLVVDVGSYNGLLGMSCNELASYSRSQHKSQGFGVSVQRGSSKEYLQLLKGEKPETDISDGIMQGWERYGWPQGDRMLTELIENFDLEKPWLSVSQMLEIIDDSETINNGLIKEWFQDGLQKALTAALGIHLEINTEQEFIPLSSEYNVRLEMINRSPVEVHFIKATQKGKDLYDGERIDLLQGEVKSLEFDISIPDRTSQPYWLVNAYDKMFRVEDQLLIGIPENLLSPAIYVELLIEGKSLTFIPPLTYTFTDRVEGEVIRPVVETKSLVIHTDESNLVFVDERAQNLEVEFRVFDDAGHVIDIEAEGWEVNPSKIELQPSADQGWQSLTLSIRPVGAEKPSSFLEFLVDKEPAMSLTEIDYSHIDKRVVFEPAKVKLVQLELNKTGEKVGYIEGAGDMVALALQQMGYQVDLLGKEDILSADLSQYKAIVAGIRAYNTQDWLPGVQEKLMQYVENGGNYIVQYNTASRDLKFRDFGPYPFILSRLRVTEEDAEVEFMLPEHPVLNVPNKLDDSDFDGWVQERGLYFASEWDEAYVAPIGWHDQGEPTRAGGLLIAEKGDGNFIYTGIAFFRQLPAGVPGAYRLLANLISY